MLDRPKRLLNLKLLVSCNLILQLTNNRSFIKEKHDQELTNGNLIEVKESRTNSRRKIKFSGRNFCSFIHHEKAWGGICKREKCEFQDSNNVEHSRKVAAYLNKPVVCNREIYNKMNESIV